MFDSVESTQATLAGHHYIADIGLSTSLFLALKMGKAIFLEGEPGVGKTEVAKVLSRAFQTPLIRLQCYEGLDVNQAVYEWNYPRQLLEIQARHLHANGSEPVTDDIFTETFLLKRPLLQAITSSHDQAPVLLIDELDRADEEFESFLLELLSDFQITIPEIGTLRAKHRPIVVITSNRTREIHDALKRRCVYHWIDYPSREKEIEILRLKAPGISEQLASQVVAFIQAVRRQELYKLPGVAETLDWAEALGHLQTQRLDAAVVNNTLGIILKYQDDVDKIRGQPVAELLVEIATDP
ncbi:MAG: MoxR family ATPase [Chloroflexi bacterium]|nr:MoxR family ATPase [Chloroflexota bacterium]MCI0581032.1 MoxR family ATPase [Chloroflexota bacterium]MCI0647558.1 MoxR family ATPase [Chloroflexota bacterium]MCI0729040.1 MoxR family ATPase [Chloroflexota bacterium]